MPADAEAAGGDIPPASPTTPPSEAERRAGWIPTPPDREAVDSPCVGVCYMDADTGLCRGCLRTIDEIEHWLEYSPADRQQVMMSLKDRAPTSRKPPRRG